jgi:cation diffusion facilitator CzcD-associated flavoprotein CzcO
MEFSEVDILTTTPALQLYSYSFAPNPNWSSTYASQPEILAYIEGVATGHHLSERIRLQQECLSATWKEDDHIWEVHFKDAASGTLYTVYCRILITSVGFLDVPRGPEDIVGFTKFQGRVFHSASWDHSVDFEGRNVVVIGNGCSANQFIPWLVKQTGLSKLTQVIRSPHWIAPKTDRIIGSKEKWYVPHTHSLLTIIISFLLQAFKPHPLVPKNPSLAACDKI